MCFSFSQKEFDEEIHLCTSILFGYLKKGAFEDHDLKPDPKLMAASSNYPNLLYLLEICGPPTADTLKPQASECSPHKILQNLSRDQETNIIILSLCLSMPCLLSICVNTDLS